MHATLYLHVIPISNSTQCEQIFQVLVKVFQGDPRLWQAYSHTLQVLFNFLISCSPLFHMLYVAQELKIS